MNLNACRWVRARLPLLAGDDLIGPDRRLTERHLVACPYCRRHLDALRGVLQTLHNAAEVPAIVPETPSLWPDLARQIRESRLAPDRYWPRLLTNPVAALAATLLLTLGTAAVWSRFQTDSSPGTLTVPTLTAIEPSGVFIANEGEPDGDVDVADEDVLVSGPASPVGHPLDGDQDAEVRNTH